MPSANAPEPQSSAPSQAERPPLPRVIRDLIGWNTLITLALGRNTGMLSVVVNQPVTAKQLSEKARVDERNAAAWLAAMTAHEYLTYQDDVFTMRADEAAAFKAFPFDFEAVIDYTHRITGALPAIEEAIRTGGGVAPTVYQKHLGDSVGRIPGRLYEYMLVAWLEQAGLAGVLRASGSLLELGFGSGAALLHLAKSFPNASFTGIDLDPGAVGKAGAEAARRGLANVRFEVRDVTQSTGDGAEDLVLILDALHHFPHPERVLQLVKKSLKPGGSLMFAESTASGDLASDSASPMARILMTSGLLYCMQEGLHDHGAGLGTTYGTNGYRELLAGAGYDDVEHFDTEAGYTLFVGRRT